LDNFIEKWSYVFTRERVIINQSSQRSKFKIDVKN